MSQTSRAGPVSIRIDSGRTQITPASLAAPWPMVLSAFSSPPRAMATLISLPVPSGLPATSSSVANTPKESVGFLLKGVVGATSKEMLQQLSIYANTKQEVVVDMSGLLRIDFNAVGGFFEVIRAIHLSQKRVILSNLNELVAALLEVFGMTKHAILMRKKTA